MLLTTLIGIEAEMIFCDYHGYGEKYDASFEEGGVIGFHNMYLSDKPTLMK